LFPAERRMPNFAVTDDPLGTVAERYAAREDPSHQVSATA